jgi:hypothetical protein
VEYSIPDRVSIQFKRLKKVTALRSVGRKLLHR